MCGLSRRSVEFYLINPESALDTLESFRSPLKVVVVVGVIVWLKFLSGYVAILLFGNDIEGGNVIEWAYFPVCTLISYI